MSGLEDFLARTFKADSYFMGPKIGALFGKGKTWREADGLG